MTRRGTRPPGTAPTLAWPPDRPHGKDLTIAGSGTINAQAGNEVLQQRRQLTQT